MRPFTKWLFFYWWNKAVWLCWFLLQCIHALRNGTSLFSQGNVSNLTQQRGDERRLSAALLKYAKYYLQTAPASPAAESYSNITPCGGTIE